MRINKDETIPNSLSIPGIASFVINIKSRKDIVEADNFAKKEGLPLLPMGDGTNIVPNDYYKGVIAILDLKGIEKENGRLKIGAGEKWDDVVKFAVENELSGIEALSAIPGKAGAAPIQNIGAYGGEVGDAIECVEIYDRNKQDFLTLSKEDCEFGYRDSIFKRNPEKWIVARIDLKLHSVYDRKNSVKIPDYKDVENYFNERKNNTPNLKEIRSAIIEIRKNKLPDPKVIPNCGSFFKNPFVTKKLVKKIKKEFPDLTVYPSKTLVKIPAGFLIEQVGFKGQKIGKIEIYKNNALVLTNPNRASFSDLIFAKETIQKAVFAKFGVMLEPEVNILDV